MPYSVHSVCVLLQRIGLMMQVWHFNSCLRHQCHLVIPSYLEPLAPYAILPHRSYYRIPQYDGRVARPLLHTWPACAGNWGVRPSQQFNLPYLIEGPRSADLQLLSRPRTYWQYFPTSYDARFEILKIYLSKLPLISSSCSGISYTRPAQHFMRCGKLRHNLVCMRAMRNSVHRMKTGLHARLRTLIFALF